MKLKKIVGSGDKIGLLTTPFLEEKALSNDLWPRLGGIFHQAENTVVMKKGRTSALNFRLVTF